MNRSSLWLPGVAVVFGLSLYANIGGAWMGDPARGTHLAATAVHLLFWVTFTLTARSPGRFKVCLFMSALTLFTAVIRLLVHAAGLDFLMLPALLFTLLFSVPLYGLRCFMGWTALDALTGVLSLIWLIYAAKKLKAD